MIFFDPKDFEKNKNNDCLREIEKKFPIVEKIRNVFELYFEDNGRLDIVECCDGYYFQSLSVEELKQLSLFFSEVASFVENNKVKK